MVVFASVSKKKFVMSKMIVFAVEESVLPHARDQALVAIPPRWSYEATRQMISALKPGREERVTESKPT